MEFLCWILARDFYMGYLCGFYVGFMWDINTGLWDINIGYLCGIYVGFLCRILIWDFCGIFMGYLYGIYV